jgi:NAD(P)-dependent dehydrogenase (short-subunit alcohol dehydrogenase family)
MTHTLVVGGTRGIGRAVVERFATEPGVVSVIARREAEDLLLPNVRQWTGDLEDSAALPARIAEIAAANGPLRNVVLLQRFRGEGDAWRGELDVSLTATKVIVESGAQAFADAGGTVVIVCSHAAHLVADDQPVGYHVAKAALRQLARYYAVTLGPKGIRVNCVTPGAVLKEHSRGTNAARMLADLTPLRRIATSEDIAAGIALLCSDDAAFVTGQDLAIDGGLSLLLQESLIQTLRTSGSVES